MSNRCCATCKYSAVQPCDELCASCRDYYPFWEPREAKPAWPPDDPETYAPLPPAETPVSHDLKHDNAEAKPKPFLLALEEYWKVALHGAKKYAPNNCLVNVTAADMKHYEEALWRHWQLRRQGEEIDPDSGLPHLAHMAWCALYLLEMEKRGVTNPEWEDA